MNTQQAVFTAQGDASAPLTAPDLIVRLKAERVQESAAAAAQLGDNVTHLYEFSVNQSQPVTIEVPLVVVTFHGQSARSIPGPTAGLLAIDGPAD